MSSYFITVLNMSLIASYVALVVMIVRFLIKKAPKIFSYCLWAVVLFRLLFPFSFESSFSLINNKIEVIPQDIGYIHNTGVNSGVRIIDNAVNKYIQSSLPTVNPEVSVNSMVKVMEIATNIWLIGIIILLYFAVVSYFKLKRRLSTATLLKENIYETDRIDTPFVLGFFKPKIYIPLSLQEKELHYILRHEQIHIKRLDYIIKPLAFFALVLHWFNPLIWVSYILMSKDMEMSCDESVMKQSNDDIRVNYSTSLLSLSAKQSGLLSPLSFGESNVKSRITNVLNYKKSAFWVLVITVVALVVVTIGMMSNPLENIINENEVNSEQITSFAWEIVNRNISDLELNPEVKIIDSKITRLELIETFDEMIDTPIDVYALEYRLLPEKPENVVMAGGMNIDEDGWLMETSSMGSPLLVISRKIGSIEFMGNLWTGGVIEEGGMEPSIKALLIRGLSEDTEKSNALQVMADNGGIQWLLDPKAVAEATLGLRDGNFTRVEGGTPYMTLAYSYGDEERFLIKMYQPVKTGNGGIWAVKSHEVVYN